jgi:hypothetical protein
MALEHSIQKGRKALFALVRMFGELGTGAIDLQMRLFDVLACSVLRYGCEVWGPRLGLRMRDCDQMDNLHRMMTRMCKGMKATVSLDVLYGELRGQPLVAGHEQRDVNFRRR